MKHRFEMNVFTNICNAIFLYFMQCILDFDAFWWWEYRDN